MERLTVREIVNSTGGRLLRGDATAPVTGVSIDTRTLQPGDVFFALKGENADGHVYVPKAVELGAGAVVVSDPSVSGETAVVAVEDPLWALGDLAKHYRSKFSPKVVGVTGSVGKTTTKEMLACILERKGNVLKNHVNFNNEIGVPLTILQLGPEHDYLVLEMAMRALGEIGRLASIAAPCVGIITNVGISHIELLGSQGSIADAKSELLTELPEDGVAVLNAEDCYFTMMKDRFAGKVMSFGTCRGADVAGLKIKCLDKGRHRFFIAVGDESVDITLPMLGYHNVHNALAAAAAALILGADLKMVREGLQGFTPPSMRMEFIESGGLTILNDAYNAGPASVLAALKTLHSLKGCKRRVAVLGDMLELGDYAAKAHRDIGSSLKDHGVEVLVTVGSLACGIADGAKSAGFPSGSIHCYSDSAEAGRRIREQLSDGDAILIKGSRAVKMEEIVRVLQSE